MITRILIAISCIFRGLLLLVLVLPLFYMVLIRSCVKYIIKGSPFMDEFPETLEYWTRKIIN